MKIRYYGLMAPTRKKLLAVVHYLLGSAGIPVVRQQVEKKTQCLPPVWLNLALYQITAEISPGHHHEYCAPKFIPRIFQAFFIKTAIGTGMCFM